MIRTRAICNQRKELTYDVVISGIVVYVYMALHHVTMIHIILYMLHIHIPVITTTATTVAL
jgi:hypothetical protein